MTMRMTAIRAALDAMYFSGTHLVSQPFLGGLGAILMFHRVRPARPDAFQPNRFLEITPDFLEETIVSLRRRGTEIVSLDEACNRIGRGPTSNRFAVLTFDDGYRDNLEHAWPVLERHEAPFTLFVTSDFADGKGHLWWQALEETIADNNEVTLTLGGKPMTLECQTPKAKGHAYKTFVQILDHAHGASGQLMANLSERYGLDAEGQCRRECMSWTELAALAESPLVTIGAHTVSHPILSHLSGSAVEHELSTSVDRISEHLGTRPVHLAYPHGGPNECGPREFATAVKLGFKSAVTTRNGPAFAEHRDHMTALPRISVNGLFQHMRYLDVLLSGAPTTLKYGFRRMAA